MMPTEPSRLTPSRGDLFLLVALALATVVIHWLTGGRYGFHRDELATLSDARHLAWGYVAYPPMTPFFARLSLVLFGTSLTGFRFFASLAQAVGVVLTGLMARELGGGRTAQLLAAAAAVPFCLVGGALMQYVSFDALCWILIAYLVVRLLRSDDPRWWLAIGAVIGLGMLAKYTMIFFTAGVVVGVLLTPLRRHLASKWLWMGVALSWLLFLPNLVWQVQHHFISLEFLRTIHARDVRIGRAQGFLPDQLKLMLFALPLAVAGGVASLRNRFGPNSRMLALMYLVPLALFLLAQGRWYYIAAAYPMLYAAGSVTFEKWSASLRRPVANLLSAALWLGLLLNMAVLGAVSLPWARVHSQGWQIASGLNGDLVEEIGWPELVRTVAQVRDTLPPQELSGLGILAANYGEAGAIELYGPQHALPQPISGVNSFWARGYGDPPPQTLIVLGLSQEFLSRNFQSCRLAARVWNQYGVENEETRDHPGIYVCRGLRQSWPEFWKDFRYFG